MSNKINLKLLFEKLENKSYSIIKLPENFPDYKIGSDLDIFCYDIEDISRVIITYLEYCVSNDFHIRLLNMGKQFYIDIIDKNKISFRFDLYGALPSYKNILIKEALFSSIIENSKKIKHNGCIIKIPSSMDENILRYIEYQEWYGQRPDKIKHINYLQKKINNSEIDPNQLFDKIHYYTALPVTRNNIQTFNSTGHFNSIYKKILSNIKKEGFKKTIKLIYKKIIDKKG